MVKLPIEVNDALQTYIFNRMPIRLLKLNIPNIEIVDRSGILAHITNQIGDIDDAQFDKMIDDQRIRSPKASSIALKRQVITGILSKYTGYAVLSHTWLQDGSEVIYQDWRDPVRIESIKTAGGEGYKKLVKFCETSESVYHLTLAWMDTICIDKSSSSELDESIRSMFDWYTSSAICIVSLNQTASLSDMEYDRWFTRGWTLQELLAPRRIKFYNMDWEPLSTDDNDKQINWIFVPDPPRPLEKIIQRVTGIDYSRLFYQPSSMAGKIAERMSWAAKRRTTRGEDIAYSLMGIFGVSISVAYGEGAERAFFRLVEAILSSTEDVVDILNWGGRPVEANIHPSRLIPSSPECFLKYVDLATSSERNAPWSAPLRTYRPLKPMILTNLGLRIRLLLVPAKLVWPVAPLTEPLKTETTAVLECTPSFWEGETTTFQVAFFDTDDYGYIQEPTYSTDVWTHFNPIVGKQMVAAIYLGLYMFNEDHRRVEIPRRTCAICLNPRLPIQADGSVALDDLSPQYIKGSTSIVNTRYPIEVQRNDKFEKEELGNGGLMVEKTQLGSQGMKIQSVYL